MSENIAANQIASFAGAPLIIRAAPVRLGRRQDQTTSTSPRLYHPSNHGAYGIESVEFDGTGSEPAIKVVTDFEDDELILHASASVDLQLAKKGIVAGVSGGGSRSTVRIYGNRPIPKKYWEPNGECWPAGIALDPRSAWANPDVDNIWLLFVSIKKN